MPEECSFRLPTEIVEQATAGDLFTIFNTRESAKRKNPRIYINSGI